MPEPRRIIPDGGKRSKKNATGSDIAANTFVILDSTEDQIKLPTGTTVALYGVTSEIIKNGYWGDVQIFGRAICRAEGALATPGVRLMSTTAGRVQAWSAGAGTNAQMAGLLETTAAVQDDLVEVELAGPGQIQQG